MPLTAKNITDIVDVQTKGTLRAVLDAVEKSFAVSGIKGGKNNPLCKEITGAIKHHVNRSGDAIKTRLTASITQE